ncbi:YggS family pyridoxal phosphate-dependent enzyme [Polaromonas sp.]|uniref:YggS family pyridoxal phosphate-dependent enzyme n=1 Tax=Polaromonas sp. TaxID=1869339 RepID=UPI0013B8546D|nr:YggS family pyridoxal phosphate-dependent enzyme [Polaromonas sp.]NDP63373.1 YggS family pyridoxal phosphate-dependent enzyme [Polaromonas sp.]
MTTIAHHLLHVHDRIHAACLACGRDPASVRLLAVSKTFGAEAVAEAMAAGQTAFGENYIAEGVDKIEALRGWLAAAANGAVTPASTLEWHCIGPVQSNKTRLVAGHFDWVQSVDRLKIAQRLSEQRPAELPALQVCLQVNIDGGANKSGVAPEAALALAREVAQLPRLVLRGLMAIPEPATDFVAACALHASAKDLFDQINASGALALPMDTLSLGMTADLEAAIHAGSTMVRVGTAIFGGRPRPA